MTITELGCTCLFLGALAAAAACGPEDDYVIQTVFDPCAPIVLEPADDASSSELDSIGDAIAMWSSVGYPTVTLEPTDDAPLVPIAFREAAPAYYGLYRDDVGDILINRVIVDRHDRAVTIAHELGHAFGLLHVESYVSVMNPGNLTNEPNADDARAVEALWGRCLPRPASDRVVRR